MMLTNRKYVLQYLDGSYVQRDDSTGPYASGGYPQRVDTLDQATQWDTIEDAASYASIGDWRDMHRFVIPLRITADHEAAIRYPATWEGCNHHCVSNGYTTAPEAKHFLDCPVMKAAIGR